VKDMADGYLNAEAEQQVLGAILCNNAAFDLVGDVLLPEHFGDPVHARIYEICGARIAKGHLVSPVALKTILESDEGLKTLGGMGYLVRMAGAAISIGAVREYAKIIIEQACRRALAQAALEAQEALRTGSDSGDIKSGLLHALHALPEVSGDETSFSLLKAVTDAVEGAVRSYQGHSSFLTTGIGPLDRIIRGFGPGDYCVLGGATSMGKTSLALEIAGNVAVKQRKGVCFVSLEMNRTELATRMASAVARVPYSELRSASDMEESQFRKWVEASQSISDAPMRIIPKHVRDLPAIHSAARKAQRELGAVGLSLIVVDYAQLVRSGGKGRYEQMTDVSIGLKHLAGMLGVPIIALVQLSRTIGERDDKRPQLSDIKESGQFENDADQVVFCHREGYWLQRQGPRADKSGQITEKSRIDWESDMAAVKNVMELIVRKNRHGKLGTAQVGFHDATNRFWDLGGEQEGMI
jgi:replicative DNA helicase